MANLKFELLFMMKCIQTSSTPITPEFEIINAVCSALEVDYETLKGKNRSDDNVEARMIIFHLLKEHTKLSFKAAGQLFNRDHTTAIHGKKSCKNLVDIKNKKFLAKVREVEAQLPGIDFFKADRNGITGIE